ncbi:MAG: UdgX family uracil-DNA binding protein [Planctomycetales bacterium]|nr:UdgX family uracil-DNA binding protein [Planctomycetales bacterium]MCA9170618.1 UdgX family uracil-DNA binding protein [Planctomycetales bacterium]
MIQRTVHDFSDWREIARALRSAQVPPSEVQLLSNAEPTLFALDKTGFDVAPSTTNAFRVPKQFLSLAEQVAYHRDPTRWNLLYRVLWRLTTDERALLEVITDDDVYSLMQMEKAVRRDAHKMKAFVRFRELQQNGETHYIAWHRPDHAIVKKVAPFFARRFRGMNWTILTPDESVTWNQSELTYHAGTPRSAAPSSDELEDLWRTYYANIFNPARIKVKAMKAEMPVRHWATLPETEIIDDLLRDAPRRVQQMISSPEGYSQTASDYFPSADAPLTLATLAEAAKTCCACDLHCQATQVVFGQGPARAKVVIVGEQPGDQEDLAGMPFVGPAGQLLDRALAAAGLERQAIYVTNVVKHFKYESQGKRRLHKRPDAREMRACLPWFDAEWELLDAQVLLCLGASAATSLIAPDFRIQRQRGQWVVSRYCKRTLASWHPASILRLPTAELREARFAELLNDLRTAASGLRSDVVGD